MRCKSVLWFPVTLLTKTVVHTVFLGDFIHLVKEAHESHNFLFGIGLWLGKAIFVRDELLYMSRWTSFQISLGPRSQRSESPAQFLNILLEVMIEPDPHIGSGARGAICEPEMSVAGAELQRSVVQPHGNFDHSPGF